MKKTRGSLTIEATLALFFFIMVFLMFHSIGRYVTYQSRVKHALSQTAVELSMQNRYNAHRNDNFKNLVGTNPNDIIQKLNNLSNAVYGSEYSYDLSLDSMSEYEVKQFKQELESKGISVDWEDIYDPLCNSFKIKRENGELIEEYLNSKGIQYKKQSNGVEWDVLSFVAKSYTGIPAISAMTTYTSSDWTGYNNKDKMNLEILKRFASVYLGKDVDEIDNDAGAIIAELKRNGIKEITIDGGEKNNGDFFNKVSDIKIEDANFPGGLCYINSHQWIKRNQLLHGKDRKVLVITLTYKIDTGFFPGKIFGIDIEPEFTEKIKFPLME